MSTNLQDIEQLAAEATAPRRFSLGGIVRNLWPLGPILFIGSAMSIQTGERSIRLTMVAAVLMAATSSMGAKAIIGHRLVDVRHIRSLTFALVVGGTLAEALRSNPATVTPAVQVVLAATACIIYAGREVFIGWTLGQARRQQMQAARIVRHHQALMAELATLPGDLADAALADLFPDVWNIVTDVPHGLRNRLVERPAE
jgi:hypothetical protein